MDEVLRDDLVLGVAHDALVLRRVALGLRRARGAYGGGVGRTVKPRGIVAPADEKGWMARLESAGKSARARQCVVARRRQRRAPAAPSSDKCLGCSSRHSAHDI